MLCATGDYRNAAVVTAVSLGTGFLLAAPVTFEVVLLTWFAATPLASFYIRYPIDRSIITYSRVVFGLLVVMLLLESHRKLKRTGALLDTSFFAGRATFSLSKFEIAWALLSVLALASAVARSNNVTYATRIAIDTFWLPLLAFYFARKHFDLRSGGRLLLLCCMMLALFLFATGAFELATGTDLFQYKGSELVREGERRVNGPFAADSSFAIICLMLFLFLQAAPRLLRVRFDRAGKLVYVCATTAAALGALLSLFRIVALALVICWIAQRWAAHHDAGPAWLKGSDLRRVPPVASMIVVIVIVVGGLLVTVAPPTFGGRLADPRSAFGRLATWQAAAEIALENPAFGVGLANYQDYFDASHYYSDEPPEEVLDTKAADSPHSNLLWIVSELGLAGLALYVAANLYLFLTGWRALKRAADQRQRIAASCFLALVVAYWISGLTVASGYYSDLNLYFLFLLGALSTQFSGVSTVSEAI
jgi:O-antigen ligase